MLTTFSVSAPLALMLYYFAKHTYETATITIITETTTSMFNLSGFLISGCCLLVACYLTVLAMQALAVMWLKFYESERIREINNRGLTKSHP